MDDDEDGLSLFYDEVEELGTMMRIDDMHCVN